MYEVKILKNEYAWCKKGQIREMNNQMAEKMEKKGVVKILRFLGHYPYSPYYLEKTISSMKQQIKTLQDKIKRYEKIMETLK